jgi:hypothetical protein
MIHTDVIAYCLDFATRLKEIQHTEDNTRFFYNIDEFIEKNSNIPKGSFVMMMDDRHKGRIQGQSNRRDYPEYGVYFLRKVGESDYADEEEAFSEGKQIALKLETKLNYEFHNESDTIARFIVDGSMTYRKEGPRIDNFHGCYFSFGLSDNINTAFDSADYI